MTTPRKNWLEWSVFGFGVALLLVVVGYLTVQLVRHEDRPATLHVELGAPRPEPSARPPHVVVPVTVVNTGDRAAVDVVVELRAGGERGELRIEEVPRRSARTGAWTVTALPAAGGPTARVLGYADP